MNITQIIVASVTIATAAIAMATQLVHKLPIECVVVLIFIASEFLHLNQMNQD